MKKIGVLLADDHAIVLQGLRLILEAAGDIRVLGEAENGRQAVHLAKTLAPDVIVLDVVMPQLNGVEAARQIIRKAPATKVLILSSYSDDDLVQQLMEMGVAGYLIKRTAAEELLKAIREVHKGKKFFSSFISKRLLAQTQRSLTRDGTVKKRTDLLTLRESEVLQLIAEGYGNKQIADELGIRVKTVEKHRQHVMNKLNIHEVATLTRYAISKGMVGNTTPANVKAITAQARNASREWSRRPPEAARDATLSQR